MDNNLANVHPELVCEWSDRNLLLTGQVIIFGVCVNASCPFLTEQIVEKSVCSFKSITLSLIISIQHIDSFIIVI